MSRDINDDANFSYTNRTVKRDALDESVGTHSFERAHVVLLMVRINSPRQQCELLQANIAGYPLYLSQ